VINLWTTPDRANPTKEGAIHMIFLDEMVSSEFSFSTLLARVVIGFTLHGSIFLCSVDEFMQLLEKI
jgi:hypothetical protein